MRVTVVIPGQPRAKARARFTKGGRTYADPKSKTHEDLLATHYRMAITEPFPNNVAVHATFYRATRQRIDVDNLMKAVLDAANNVVWEDDSQVTHLSGRLHFDKEYPRTEVTFEVDESSTMPRGKVIELVKTCERCGKDFTYRDYPSRLTRRFCSKACVKKGANGAAASCEHCGTEFKQRSVAQKYCSKECGYKARHARARAALPNCQECGKKLHRYNAVLCRECWLAQSNKTKRKQDFLDEGDAA